MKRIIAVAKFKERSPSLPLGADPILLNGRPWILAGNNNLGLSINTVVPFLRRNLPKLRAGAGEYYPEEAMAPAGPDSGVRRVLELVVALRGRNWPLSVGLYSQIPCSKANKLHVIQYMSSTGFYPTANTYCSHSTCHTGRPCFLYGTKLVQ